MTPKFPPQRTMDYYRKLLTLTRFSNSRGLQKKKTKKKNLGGRNSSIQTQKCKTATTYRIHSDKHSSSSFDYEFIGYLFILDYLSLK